MPDRFNELTVLLSASVFEVQKEVARHWKVVLTVGANDIALDVGKIEFCGHDDSLLLNRTRLV